MPWTYDKLPLKCGMIGLDVYEIRKKPALLLNRGSKAMKIIKKKISKNFPRYIKQKEEILHIHLIYKRLTHKQNVSKTYLFSH